MFSEIWKKPFLYEKKLPVQYLGKNLKNSVSAYILYDLIYNMSYLNIKSPNYSPIGLTNLYGTASTGLQKLPMQYFC